MNEEEIKAMNECKILMICLYDYMSIEKSRFYCNQYKIILELIEKQQKEIENLKFKYQARKDRTKVIINKQKKEIKTLKESQFVLYGHDGNIAGCIRLGNDVISKDKIKEKIKYYHKQREKAETKKINDMYVNYIDCLEELLRGIKC